MSYFAICLYFEGDGVSNGIVMFVHNYPRNPRLKEKYPSLMPTKKKKKKIVMLSIYLIEGKILTESL